ncbi:MAG TPA: GrpB family protein, partial [Tepidisphaeraceae bacterium]
MDDDGVLIGGREKREIVIVEYDARWPEAFASHARAIRSALGDVALAVEHIGSTAVPGLAAKPIIDVIVVVPNSADEPAYLPALLAAGYVLRVREPDWHEHRMLRTAALDAHVHVYSAGCAEVARQLAFR